MELSEEEYESLTGWANEVDNYVADALQRIGWCVDKLEQLGNASALHDLAVVTEELRNFQDSYSAFLDKHSL